VAIEILNMQVTRDAEFVLAEAKRLDQHPGHRTALMPQDPTPLRRCGRSDDVSHERGPARYLLTPAITRLCLRMSRG
jgi:hypothetical protein